MISSAVTLPLLRDLCFHRKHTVMTRKTLSQSENLSNMSSLSDEVCVTNAVVVGGYGVLGNSSNCNQDCPRNQREHDKSCSAESPLEAGSAGLSADLT